MLTACFYFGWTKAKVDPILPSFLLPSFLLPSLLLPSLLLPFSSPPDDYFVFQMWSAAQIVTLRASAQPNRRFLSINRAFSPGASRLGVVVWTGECGFVCECTFV